jgi:hypothetical protein
MCSIKDGLQSVGLEKYQEAFESRGLLSVNDLTSCTPADLDRVLTEMGMLKGHTFKMKKLVDEIKAGVEIKPRPSSSFKALPEGSMIQTKIDTSKFQEASIDKSKPEVLTQEIMTSSLNDFLALDLEVYHKALCQLKHIQMSVRSLIEETKASI